MVAAVGFSIHGPVERVKAGLRDARAKGKRLGRPKRVVDAQRIAELRTPGRRLEEDFAGDERWRRNALPACRTGFQNSGKGFLNHKTIAVNTSSSGEPRSGKAGAWTPPIPDP